MTNGSTGKKKDKSPRHIAFSISGGGYTYQMGVARYIQENFDLTDVHFSGGSGGSWAALLLATKVDIRFALETLLEYGPHCARGRSLGAYGVYDRGMKEVHDKVFEGIDLATVLNGKLAISITRITLSDSLGVIPFLKDEVITEFYSNDDVIQCIIASALIPFALNGYPFVRFRDWICVDAGLTNVAGVRRFFGTSATAQELFHDTITTDCRNGGELGFNRLASLSSHYAKVVAEYLANNSLTKNCFTKFLDSKLNDKIQYQTLSGNDYNINPQAAPSLKLLNNFVKEDVEAILNSTKNAHKSVNSTPKGKSALKQPSKTAGITNKENENGAGMVTPVASKFNKALSGVLTDSSKKLLSATPQRMRGRAFSDAETVFSEVSFRSDLPTIPRVSAPYGLVQLGYMTTKAVFIHITTGITKQVTDAIVSAADRYITSSVARGVSTIVTSVFPRDLLDSVLQRYVPSALRRKLAEKAGVNVKAIADKPAASAVRAIEAGDNSNQEASNTNYDRTDGNSNGSGNGSGSEKILEEGDGEYSNDDTAYSNSSSAPTALITSTSTGFCIRKMEKEAIDALADLLGGISHPFSQNSYSIYDSDSDSIYSSSSDDDADEAYADDFPATPQGVAATPPAAGSNAAALADTPSHKSRVRGHDKEHSMGHLWNTKSHIIKKLEHGGLLLEIAPWTWRRQPLFHYHLTADPQQVQRLFDLGYADAKKHHRELSKFFKNRSTA